MQFTWPRGYRCAVVLSFDVDGELLWKVWSEKAPSIIDASQGVYDLKVGVPRVLEMLDRVGIKATFFVPGWIIERYPDPIREIVRFGHEIAHHGYLHEDCSRLSEDEERRILRLGIQCIERFTGRRPKGFRLIPSNRTFRLLEEFGFLYDSVLMDDDLPYRLIVDGKKSNVIELPVSFSFNDTSYFLYTFGLSKPILAPREVELIYRDEFDELYKEGKFCMFMLHPQVIGRPSRLRMLERVIRYMKRRKGVWFATAEEVAEYCNNLLK